MKMAAEKKPTSNFFLTDIPPLPWILEYPLACRTLPGEPQCFYVLLHLPVKTFRSQLPDGHGPVPRWRGYRSPGETFSFLLLDRIRTLLSAWS